MSIQELYPDCIFLSLQLNQRSTYPLALCESDLLYQQLYKYLRDSLGLNVQPCHANGMHFTTATDRNIDGFVLVIEGVRVAFIPNQDIDTEGFEIARTWVGLSTAIDYFVPIQVDLESESACLWGFISRPDLKKWAEYDPAALTYLVDSKYLDNDLDNLWLMCELQTDGAISIIEEHPVSKLSNWLAGTVTAIDRDWKSIAEFFHTTQERLKELTICPQANLMYRSAGTNVESLVSIIHSTTSQHDRWEAIEHLWKIDPEHPALPIYKLFDLGLFFQGEKLSLLVSIVPTKNKKLGILIRLSPNDNSFTLPINIKLSRLDENAHLSREVIAQDRDYQCLQLIFDADLGDKFSACVILNNKQFIKHFEV